MQHIRANWVDIVVALVVLAELALWLTGTVSGRVAFGLGLGTLFVLSLLAGGSDDGPEGGFGGYTGVDGP